MSHCKIKSGILGHIARHKHGSLYHSARHKPGSLCHTDGHHHGSLHDYYRQRLWLYTNYTPDWSVCAHNLCILKNPYGLGLSQRTPNPK